jgi:hypothetical protein
VSRILRSPDADRALLDHLLPVWKELLTHD